MSLHLRNINNININNTLRRLHSLPMSLSHPIRPLHTPHAPMAAASSTATQTEETRAQTETDLLIIGGGPGGLGTAIAFARTLRSWILYDSGSYRNAPAESAHTIMAFDGASPATWRARVRDDLALGKYVTTGEMRNSKVVQLRRIREGKNAGGFEAVDSEGRSVLARKVVLATGVKDVLANIPGLEEQWGKRAIHCLFCHGTETAGGRMGFLLSRTNAANNAGVIGAALTMWAAIPHPRRVVLTNGIDIDHDEQDVAGLAKYRKVLEARGFEINTAPITRITGTNSLSLAGPGIELDYIMCVPEQIEPSADVRPLLTPTLLEHWDLQPFGALPPAPADAPPAHMAPRAGADPRTAIKGLFWAGNAGSPHSNVTMATAQGQLAAIVAADELANEDLAREVASAAA